jgi:hypothetical protein
MLTVTDAGYLMAVCFDRYHMHANSEGMTDGIGECIMAGTQVLSSMGECATTQALYVRMVALSDV